MVSLTDPIVHVLWLAPTGLITAALAVYGLRNRHVRGSRPFTGLMLSFAVYSFFHMIGLLVHEPQWRFLLNDVRWTGTALLPLFWLWFALEYTGQDTLTTPRALRALSVIPAVMILLVWTNDWHSLVWLHNDVTIVDGLAIMDHDLGPGFWMWLTYTYAAGCIGAFLLIRIVWASDFLFTDQSVLLVVGVTAPILASVLTTFELGPNTEPAIDLAPYSFALTGLAFGFALFRHQLFDFIPATRHLGRNTAIRQLDDGLVIVDGERRIVYLNPAVGSILGRKPAALLGSPIHDVIVDLTIEFGVADALAELERDGRTYEVQSSPIEDRRDHLVGHTLLFHDVTERKRRERVLVRQRDELETVNQLNAIIRGVNKALVSTTSREEILDAVCSRLADSELYETAIAADVPTWRGTSDRWITRGQTRAIDSDQLPAILDDPTRGSATAVVEQRASGTGTDRWTVIPLSYRHTIYGALALCSDRDDVSDRERDVLSELGGLMGHAIDAVENRQLLDAETVVEVELESTGGDTVLGRVSADASCRITLDGLVSASEGSAVAYLGVDPGSVDGVRDLLVTERAGTVRVLRREDGLVEWTLEETNVLRTLDTNGSYLRDVTAAEGVVSYTVELGSEADVRVLLDRIRDRCPDISLVAKREHTRSIEPPEHVFDGVMDDLTDRQRESLEAAYRAGYFEWPRESTAEEVAESLGISRPTLQAHLRKAERAVTERLFENGNAS